MSHGKEILSDVLLRIDEEATLLFPDCTLKLRMVIVGGSALLLSDLTNRPVTYDIDMLSCDERLRDIVSKYRIVNSAVSAFADQIPYNFEDRLVELAIPSKTIVFLTPSPEDLAVMKLYGWRGHDIEDLDSKQFLSAIHWDALDKLVFDPNESRASAISERRYREMVSVYENYAREHGHEPNVQGLS